MASSLGEHGVIIVVGAVLLLPFLQLLAFLIFKLRRRAKPTAELKLCGPWQIWVDHVLTAYPLLSLLLGICLPLSFSLAGLQRSNFDVKVNLDFSSYLAAELEEQYLLDLTKELSRDQEERSANLQQRGQERWQSWNFVSASMANVSGRRLRSQEKSFWKLDLFYEAKDSERGVFTSEALEEIRSFEGLVKAVEGYEDFCRKRFSEHCDPPYSVINIFYPGVRVAGDTMEVIYDGSGSLASIEGILRGFLRDGVDWWVDKDFGPQNLKSQYTRSSFFGGLPVAGYPDLARLEEQKQKSGDFLIKLWKEVLRTSGEYKHVVISWAEGEVLYDHEVQFYLISDCWFCLGTFLLVTMLVFLRQQSLVTTLSGMLGVLLAFGATFYFHCAVMGYERLTVMDFISLFLVIGIAADNVLLLYNTYQLAPALHRTAAMTPAEKMRWAYREAAGRMLVTTATTCGSFYANALSIVRVVRGFGLFTGTLIAWNFLNVLTIFSASVLVNDIYMVPCLRRLPCCRRAAGHAPEASPRRRLMQSASNLARQFTKDGSRALQLQPARLDRVERFVDQRFRHCLVACRWALLLTSLFLGGLMAFLAYSGFQLASGDIQIFAADINLGRMNRLTSEVFPSYSSADLNANLAIINPLQSKSVPSCPRLSGAWCSGRGSCDTFTGQCVCQESYVGQVCSVPSAPAALEQVSWPDERRSYELLHVLGRPSMLAAPAAADLTANISFLNWGDEAAEWAVEVPSTSWLGLTPSSGVVEARSFDREDVSSPGRGGFLLKYFLGSKPAGFFGAVNGTISSPESSEAVRFSLLVIQPPALASLDVEVDGLPVTALQPAFALDYGFSEVDATNLALAGQSPILYRIAVPLQAQSILVHPTAYATASRVEVIGGAEVTLEPGLTTVLMRVFSVHSDAVSVDYQLEVHRQITWDVSSTRLGTTSTTTYCPGDPVCGGLRGDCLQELDSWRCSCRETYEGADCTARRCPVCRNGGSCVNGSEAAWSCACLEAFQGPRCELFRCPNDCSGSGHCDGLSGLCNCSAGYAGVDCSDTTTGKVPITNCIDVVLVWGLIGHEADDKGSPAFSGHFDLFAAETQVWIRDTCRLARADETLQVREELNCWIEGFEEFVNESGGRFPVVGPGLSSQAFQAFMHQDMAKAFYGDVATYGEDYDGRPYFARVRLKIDMAQNANLSSRLAARERWTRWVKERNALAPARAGPMLMVSGDWARMELENQVVGTTLMAFLGSVAVSCLAVAIFTQNAIIALFTCLNVILVVCVLAGFLLNLMSYEFGVAEAIGATVFVGLSVDHCLHLAHAYHQAPGDQLAKIRHALVLTGASILGGALTTMAGTAFLLPCRIILFQKLGWTLFANSAVSMILTFSFLSPMLIIFGPTGSTGDFCPCLRRSSQRFASGVHGTINLDALAMSQASSREDVALAMSEREKTVGTIDIDRLDDESFDAGDSEREKTGGSIDLDLDGLGFNIDPVVPEAKLHHCPQTEELEDFGVCGCAFGRARC